MSINNISAERAICSTLMYDITSMEKLIGVLNPDEFFDEVCTQIFTIASESYATRRPFNEHIVLEKLPQFSEVVMSIVATAPVSIETLLALKDTVVSTARKRNLVVKLEEVKQDVISGKDYDLSELQSDNSHKIVYPRSNQSIIEAMQAKIDNPDKGHGMGIRELDKLVDPEPGTLIVIAARPSMGKTAFVLGVMKHLLQCGEGSLFFSLEMPVESIMVRMLSNMSKENIYDIKANRIKNWKTYSQSMQVLKDTDLFLTLDDSVDEKQIFNLAASIVTGNPKIKNIFIDHLTYIKDSGKSNQNNHLRIGLITKAMKRLAKEFGLKVYILSQLNRGLEQRPNKRPMLSDLRESGSIEEDADIVIGVYRDSYYESRETGEKELSVNPAEFLVLKNRDGEVGVARSNFYGPQVRFTDDEYNYEETVYVSEEITGVSCENIPQIDIPEL